ncbi:hypothetical protein [Microcystis aeruginosa]|uniref:Uncharacterized protein n=1 Tax=Microcystis aeruginosa PCC 9808 TaxID=1160284 RepID=I4HIZ9_MICAE|nr:hypothetical protein [Microcystis aeruginosa]CCI22023.1 hypothetical protein MICAG_1590025 [Microcystis aeruginosa PCC 9808]
MPTVTISFANSLSAVNFSGAGDNFVRDLLDTFTDTPISISSHAKLITCPIELKPLRGNDRHV